MMFVKPKPKFVSTKHLSIEAAIQRQTQDEIGPEQLKLDEEMMIRRKYGVLTNEYHISEHFLVHGEAWAAKKKSMQELRDRTYARAA